MGKKKRNIVARAVIGAYKYVKSYDDYGQPVTFNYKGDETFQTMPGALITLTVKVCLLMFLYYKGKQLFMDDNWDLETQIVAANNDDLTQLVNLGD